MSSSTSVRRKVLERIRSKSLDKDINIRKPKSLRLSRQRTIDGNKLEENDEQSYDNQSQTKWLRWGRQFFSNSDPQLEKGITPDGSMFHQRSNTLEAETTLAEKLCLTPKQQKFICNSWAKITDILHKRDLLLMERVFDNLCFANRDIKATFVRSACMKGIAGERSGMASKYDHAKCLLQLVNVIVTNFDKDGNETMNTLRDLGQKHIKVKIVGFQEEFWDKLSQTFVDLISTHEYIRKQPEVTKAWTVLIESIVASMKLGFNKRKRIQKQQAIISCDYDTNDDDEML